MRRFFACAAVLAVVWFAPVCGRADDEIIAQTIAQKIEQQRASGNLRGFNVELQVSEGTVELLGHTSSAAQRDTIIDIARRVRGVKKVVNGLEVSGSTEGVPTGAAPSESRGAAMAEAPRNESRGPVAAEAPRSQTRGPVAAEAPRNQSRGVAAAEAPRSQSRGVVSEVSEALKNAFGRRDVNQVSGSLPLTAAEQMPRDVAVRPMTTGAPRASSQPHQAVRSAALTGVDGSGSYGDPTPAAVAPVRGGQPAQFPVSGAATGSPRSILPSHAHGGHTPVAFAPAAYAGEMTGAGVPAMPAAMYMGGGEAPVIAHYDHPQMPNYAWPSYAPYPNYGAVTYPRQYSPTVWPYIGPFYPYPQVPLGWRKVTLEWDDGWWMLDFKSKH